VRRLAASLLLTAGCSGFVAPTPEQLKALGPLLSEMPSRTETTRVRVHLSVDSGPLAGEFDGVLAAKFSAGAGVVRAQFFGDLGPKMIDLAARSDRIVGYFPQTGEGVDCALPREATPHPLLFMGASLLENFSIVTPERVQGIREESDGTWLLLRPHVKDLEVQLFIDRAGAWKKRRFRWMYGISWDEDWSSTKDCRIAAPGFVLRIRIGEQELNPTLPPTALDLALPSNVRIVAGSRK